MLTVLLSCAKRAICCAQYYRIPPMANVRVYGATRQSASRAGSPMLTGVLLGAVLVIAWVALVWVTHNGVGLSAWGVGALLGVVVAKVARPPGKATGMLAAVLTIGTVLLAKVCVVVFALQPILHDELARNQETITALYMVEMTKSRSFSPTPGRSRIPPCCGAG